MKQVSAFPCVLIALLACGRGPPPRPNAVTGLTGVALDDAAQLNGTWGSVVELATILRLPVLGDRNAGSQQLWLHTRIYDAAAGEFKESFRWCTIDVWEVEGNSLTIDRSTLYKHPAVLYAATVDTGQGTYLAPHLLDIWALRGMPDPENTALPTRNNWQQPPQSDWIFDEDEDGFPATTGHTHGITGGEVYQVVRGRYAFKGTVVSHDRIQGLVTMQEYQQNVIKSTNPLAEGESAVHQDPDPRKTWFDMVRLQDGATCADVEQAQADGRLASRRPF